MRCDLLFQQGTTCWSTWSHQTRGPPDHWRASGFKCLSCSCSFTFTHTFASVQFFYLTPDSIASVFLLCSSYLKCLSKFDIKSNKLTHTKTAVCNGYNTTVIGGDRQLAVNYIWSSTLSASFRSGIESTKGWVRPLSLFDFLFLVFDESVKQDELDLSI